MQLQNCFCQNTELFCIFLHKVPAYTSPLHLHVPVLFNFAWVWYMYHCHMWYEISMLYYFFPINNSWPFFTRSKDLFWGWWVVKRGWEAYQFFLNGFCYSIALYIITFILFMVSRSCSSWWADDKASSRMSVSFMSLSRSCFFNSSTEEASSASYKLSIGIIMLYTSFYPHAFHSFCSLSQNLFQMIVLLASSHKETSHSWNNLGSMLLANENAGALCLTQLLHDNHSEAIALWLRQLLTRSIVYLRTRGVGALDKALTIWHVDL